MLRCRSKSNYSVARDFFAVGFSLQPQAVERSPQQKNTSRRRRQEIRHMKSYEQEMKEISMQAANEGVINHTPTNAINRAEEGSVCRAERSGADIASGVGALPGADEAPKDITPASKITHIFEQA